MISIDWYEAIKLQETIHSVDSIISLILPHYTTYITFDNIQMLIKFLRLGLAVQKYYTKTMS